MVVGLGGEAEYLKKENYCPFRQDGDVPPVRTTVLLESRERCCAGGYDNNRDVIAEELKPNAFSKRFSWSRRRVDGVPVYKVIEKLREKSAFERHWTNSFSTALI